MAVASHPLGLKHCIRGTKGGAVKAAALVVAGFTGLVGQGWTTH